MRRVALIALVVLTTLLPALRAEGFRRVGIMTATKPELEPFLAQLRSTRETKEAGRTFHQGFLEGMPAVVVEGGVGKVNATLTAALLISRFEVDLVLFSGVAAGVDEDLGIGDVVVSSQAVQVDYLRIAGGKAVTRPVKRLDHDGRHKEIGVRPPRALLDVALAAGKRLHLPRTLPLSKARPEVVPGVVCTADAFVADPKHARWVRKRFQGAVYEMEGAAVAQTCRASGVPWLIFRGVSDHSNDLSTVTYPLTRGKVAANAALALFETLAVLQGR